MCSSDLQEVFNGRRNEELFREYGHYLFYITDIFLPSINSDNGDFLHLPFPGSVMDQPYMSMQILKLIQLNYRKVLSSKMEKIKR